MGNSNAYEIRHALLSQAKDMLFEEWHGVVNVEAMAANFENRAPKPVPAPTVAEVKSVAESLYEFVQKR
jgi:hypothetical protein